MLPPLTLKLAIEKVVREEWGRILASVAKSTGDLQLAEDSLQDALETALAKWGDQGLPQSPAGWLITAAKRKAIDRIRRDKSFTAKKDDIAYLAKLETEVSQPDNQNTIPDKRLELIFTCCHPALAEKTRIALTLRAVGGLSTDEIANAFLDDPRAIAQRLVRAKQKIRLANIPYEVPGKGELPARIKEVLGVIYLVFNAGYSSKAGEHLTKVDLIKEAIRLARVMNHLIANEAEIMGLLSLMILHDARRLSRLGGAGEFVALEHQNRSKWNKVAQAEGTEILKAALRLGAIGAYQLQAAISALHLEAGCWEDTDWPQIAALYGLLYNIQPTSVVRINQAMAVSFAQSPAAALEMLQEIGNEKGIEKYQAYHLAKADLLQRQGNDADALLNFLTALPLASNEVEKVHLENKILALQEKLNSPQIVSSN